ncbi:hypothetical protein E2562_009110 [Oryza meyeriana var. granulata]|uniref:F-box domain-containing protein n=1 Tax=Oryza meyeriana var. granulata TaxID=110450 RepID=A0A6G1D1C1_9ORYZ|nr:hypothetical protein E2562_009105 [Oryza meyeriana var. granulata]KAF0906112.1 hypothetical protein E2562_009110 [Oryza meyeriana var. granulata]
MSGPRHVAMFLETGHGLDTEGLSQFMNAVLSCVYLALPDPPVSTTATLSAADAPAGDGGVSDLISLLPDDLLRAVVSRLPAKDGARTAVLSSR